MKEEKYEILIADDSEYSFQIIQEILDVIGVEIELYSAVDGKIACEIAAEVIPDLILMDVVMPVMDGIEAVKFLRKNEATADIPIIVFSATESLEKAFNAGANDFISKPFEQFELLIKVRSALNLVHKIQTINTQKVELEKQHEQVRKQKEEIIEDIHYSRKIQQAIFPSDDFVRDILPEHFILNMPKNIVSGDFYWAGKLKNSKVVALADCTGHGISGAFMTTAGIAFLNEIHKGKKAIQASDFLFELRLLVMKLLKQKEEKSSEAADGMDISLIIIDEKKKQIQFAGANSPLYHIRNGELTIYKGDRMPIGINLNFKRPFTNQIIEYQANDMIYMFSDGYADQFGGPRNKKFRYKQLQELLMQIFNLPLKEQNTELYRTICDWKGNNEQIDDILLMGARL